MTEQTNHRSTDEISLKDLILKFKDYWNELWRNWILIGLFCLPFLIYFMYKHFDSPVEYKADLSYMLNTTNDNSIPGFASILGSFGLNRNSRGFSLEKLVELSKSRTIVQQTLFNKISIEEREDFIANFLIDYYDYHSIWEKDKEELVGFYFKSDNLDSFTIEENYVLKSLYSRIIGNSDTGIIGLMSSTYDDDSGILHLSIQTVSEILSTDFANLHFEELKEFFITTTIEKQKLNYEIMKQKTDSLSNELRTAEFDLANFKDTNLGIFTKKDHLTELRLESKIRMLYAGLAKALENLEIADFTLKYQTPFIQTIDRPVMPLGANHSSLLFQILKSLLIGGLLGGAFVILRKVYQEVMQS